MREAVEKLVTTFEDLNRDENPPEEAIGDSLLKIAEAFDIDVSSEEIKQAVAEVVARMSVTTDFGSVLTAADHKPWLGEKKDSIEWKHFQAYQKVLRNEFRLSPKVIQNLDNTTDSMLDLLGDPTTPGEWHRKGLVVGAVQSGKTSNIIGLLNKAADAGYKLFVVIGGHTKPLRSQTQSRIDQGFTGQETKDLDQSVATAIHRRPIGVGKHWDSAVKIQSFTTEERDFSAVLMRSQNYRLTADMSHPVVLVVKKNARVLKNINDWLKAQAIQEMPLLVIDDESDYASVNTRREDQDPTSVNREIRRMLAISTKSTYAAFTATPFANILIDVEATHVVGEDELDDLFPTNFIVSLDNPSNYVGPQEIFGREAALPGALITEVEDAIDIFPVSQKSDLLIEQLPDSLCEAICTFFAGTAIRAQRGDADEPKSMMINTSHFVNVQAQTHQLVQDYVRGIKHLAAFSLSEEGEMTASARTLEEIFAAASKYYSVSISEKRAFFKELKTQIGQTSVSVRNSRSAEPEEESLNSIIIGGHVLSRGLTLEGLMVSYFLRSGSAMDSLLQMGRWFGYRDRYQDLVRVWMRPEVAEWFTLIADVVEDILLQIREMNRQNSTPELFGLRIRLHPGRLRVTSASKSRAATEMRVNISLAGSSYETFTINEASFSGNWAAMGELLREVVSSSPGMEEEKTGTGRPRKVFRDVKGSVVARFLEEFQFQNSPLGDLSPLYRKLASDESTAVFDVSIAEGKYDRPLPLPGGLTVFPVTRSLRRRGSGMFAVTENRRVAASGDLYRSMRASDRESCAGKFSPSGRPRESEVRSCISVPILTLYPIMDVGEDKIDEVVVAHTLTFPAPPPGANEESPAFKSFLYNAVAFKQAELFDWDTFAAEDDEDDD